MKKSVEMGANDKVNTEGRNSRCGTDVGRFLSTMSNPSTSKIKPVDGPESASATVSEQSSAAASTTQLPYSSTSESKTMTGPSATASAPTLSGSNFKPPQTDTSKGLSLTPMSAAVAASKSVDLYKPVNQRGKSIILMNNKPVAVFMQNKSASTNQITPNQLVSTRKAGAPHSVMFTKKSDNVRSRHHSVKIVEPEPDPTSSVGASSDPQDTPGLTENEVKTYRMHAPNRRKNIVVSVGDEEAKLRREKIFETSQIRKKAFLEWRKEAKSLLPSVSGGAPIEKLTDVLQAMPSLHREKNPKILQNKIRRLSEDSQGKSSSPRHSLKRKSVKADYTKPREIQISMDESTKDSSSSSAMLSEYNSDEEKELQEEYERHVADIPVKEHVLYGLEVIGDFLHDMSHHLLFWNKEIKEINGRYGTLIASYFTWLRQVLIIEIVMFMVCLVIIIIPELADQATEEENTDAHIWVFRVNDLITGEGYFHHSYLFYSGYENRHDDEVAFQNTAFRFLFCIGLKFILITYFIFSRLTRYYQSVRMESHVQKTANMEHFKTIICGWDYSCRDSQAKLYLHKTIWREMKNLCVTSRKGTTRLHIEAESKKFLALAIKHLGLFWGPWAIHIMGNVLILVTCAFLGLILIYLCRLKLYYYLHCVAFRDDKIPRSLNDSLLCPNGDDHLYTWILSLPAFFASMATLLLTKFILIVGNYETWESPQRKIYANMIRAGLFYFTNIGVFYVFWLIAKPELNDQGFVAETIFGKELYRLVVIQGLIDVTLNLGVKGIYHLLRRKSSNYKLHDFNTESSCLSMFFLHSVSRIGVLFCPPLSFFVCCRLVMDYYLNKFSLFYMSSQENYYTSVARVYGPFLLTFFIFCYLVTFFMNIYYLANTIPSHYDGPFEVYNVSYDEVLTLLISSNKIGWMNGLTEPGFTTTTITLLLALAFFTRGWALAYEPVLVELQSQIALERSDRDLLLKAIFEIGKVTSDLGDEDQLRAKTRRAAIMRRISVAYPTSDEESDDENEDSAEYKTDQQIDELIKHVQRRKSLGVTDSHSVHMFRTARKSETNLGLSRVSEIENDNTRQHIKNAEAIVAKIVRARRTLMFDGPILETAVRTPQYEGHNAMSNLQQQRPSTP